MAYAREAAETIGLECLAWLAGHEDLLGVFMGATGADRDTLREGAQDPVFLASVLEFVMQDDAWVVEFCAAAGRPNEAVQLARAALPGGQQTHWT
ncbi:DUF3572 domain-containing protein [Roseovarius aestuariivivens]|uniref:DUF3572 domain-containing protein n=1 Tax=Roseovarius aestuariivivens TaxID=1888910 RepID=UPI001080FBFA|nr:DUF3572 domain-containing protein [Roseovarius aestuariivivens]